MLIDDLRALDIYLPQSKIRDAIVFRINEQREKFRDAQIHVDTYKFPLCQRLPYTSIVIHFDNELYWLTETEDSPIEGCYTIFSVWLASAKSELTKTFSNILDNQPIFVMAYYINNITNDWVKYELFTQDKGGPPESDARSSFGERLAVDGYLILQKFLQILSCKNIKTELEKPDDKIQKKRLSRGKLPLVSYYVLKIKNVAADHESTKRGLWSNRVHFCRGHMREYTAAAPLFGRIAGRFWIPPHVRGNKQKGMIMKDYELSTGD